MHRESGVSLVDAVAASCAVPGIWPPVTIAGHRYMDGGVRSATNADLARGDERILILNPLGANATLFGTGSAKEAAALAGRLSEPVSAMEKRRAPLLADVRSPLESQDPSGER